MKIQYMLLDLRIISNLKLSVNEDGFLTGGKDRKIVLMDNEGNPLQVIFNLIEID